LKTIAMVALRDPHPFVTTAPGEIHLHHDHRDPDLMYGLREEVA
jgi:hypothetical protein